MNTEALVLSIIAILLLVLWFFIYLKLIQERKTSKKYKERYDKYYEVFKDGIDANEYKESMQKDLDFSINTKNELDKEIKSLTTVIEEKKKILDLFLEEENILEFGFYKLQYDFGTAEDFKSAFTSVRSTQKEMIKNDTAIISSIEWTIGDSKVEGRKIINNFRKMMLWAFNGDCDSLIESVKYSNIQRYQEKIQKIFEQINKAGERFGLRITDEFKELKTKELKLVYEYQEKLFEEKEEQKQIKEQMREEEKARREIEKAQIEAEKEEKMYMEQLLKAQQEIADKHGEELEKYMVKIRMLELELQEAQENKARALSMAQQTKRGHVYIISNIGSFGEDIFKIGMTRRLEPMDRVKELGDASVPFEFDVHALIYSENAPELETKLHQTFHDYRVNKINERKEFFNVKLDAIEKVVHDNHGDFTFTKIALAKEYRESLSMINNIID